MINHKKKIRMRAFTLVELLTTLAIMGILVSLLIPALSMVQKTARTVKQKAQFHTIELGLEAFRSDFGDYPPSNLLGIPDIDTSFGTPYCGAQKLAEALIGQDGFGFNPQSKFRRDLTDGVGAVSGTALYKPAIDNSLTPVQIETNLKSRKGPYLELDTANAVKLSDIYGNFGTLNGDLYVLADMFATVKHRKTGKRTGMPVLYYRADTTKFEHDAARWEPNPSNVNNLDIYNYSDNMTLTQFLPAPWDNTIVHPLRDATVFYNRTLNPNFISPPRPYRSESFILISAGHDGLYGTPDDVYNIDEQDK